jgi:hypothetical protein
MGNGLFKQMQRASAMLFALTPLSAYALDLTVQVGYEAAYSDNVGLTPTNEKDGWIQTPQIFLAASQESDSISLSADYNVADEMYPDNTFDDQTTATGNAAFSWRAIADLLTFDLTNASTQTTIASQGANVPTNQQITNTTDAGATLRLRGPSNHEINLHYDYAIVTAQRTDTDNKRQTGTAAYVIPLSDKRRVQLNASYTDVKYDSSQNSDYTSPSGNLQFVNEGDSIDLDTSVGYTVLDQKQGAENVSGTIGDIHVLWRVGAETSLNASYARSIQTQSDNVTEGIPNFGQTFADNTDVTTPYTLDATTAGISTRLGHNLVNLTGYIENQDYEGASPTQVVNANAQDQDTRGVTLNITRALRSTLNGQMYVNYSTADFKDDDDNQDNFGAGLRVDWTQWRHLSISFATEYTKRTSDQQALEYTEWRSTIGFYYTLVGEKKKATKL